MAKRKVRRKRVKRNPRRISAAAGGSLRGAISGLSTYHKRLMHDRAEIDAKISAIESALSAMGTAPARGAAAPRGGRGGGRGVRAGSLKYYIGRVLASRCAQGRLQNKEQDPWQERRNRADPDERRQESRPRPVQAGVAFALVDNEPRAGAEGSSVPLGAWVVVSGRDGGEGICARQVQESPSLPNRASPRLDHQRPAGAAGRASWPATLPVRP
jgi:hypothetical protein